MVLAEALMARKDLVKKIERIKKLITNSLVTYKDMPIDIDLNEQLKLYTDKMVDLEDLNAKIDRANAVNVDALSKLRVLDSKLGFYKEISDSLANDSRMSFRSIETEMVKNLNTVVVEKVIEELEIARRNVDKKLQKANWTTEI